MSEADVALDIEALLTALADAEVRFVAIGGLAVNAHGFLRATKDIDIVPDPAPGNLDRLADLLGKLDARLLGFDEFDPDELPQPDREGLALGGNFELETSLGRLDILQLVQPDRTYDILMAGAKEIESFGVAFMVCGYEDLVAMKEAADRDQDRLDLKLLRQARGEEPSD